MPVPVIFRRPRRLMSLPYGKNTVLLASFFWVMVIFLSASLSIGMKQILPREAHHD